jgi:hypothetical protein
VVIPGKGNTRPRQTARQYISRKTDTPNKNFTRPRYVRQRKFVMRELIVCLITSPLATYPSGVLGFQNYQRVPDDFDGTLKAIRKDFKFVGPTGIYFFLYVVGEKVPPHEEFEATYRK